MTIDVLAPYEALPWQRPAWRDKSLIKLLTGSAGGGKSRLAAEIVNAFCLKYPGATALMLRKTAESAKNSIALFMEHTVMGGENRIAQHRRSDNRFDYPNGSMLHYGGMKDDYQREKVRSIGAKGGVDLIWLEEAVQFTENDYNELLARLRGDTAGWRQFILTTNPGAPAHWIYQRLILKKQATVFKSSALDNPHNPPEYLTILNQLTGLLHKRLVLGQWVMAEGAVFPEFDPDLHVVRQLPTDPFYFRRVIAGVDWGYTNPGVIQVYGVDGDGRLWMVHEIYRTRQQVDSWWVKEAIKLRDRYRVREFYCDPSQPAYIQIFNDAGLTALPAENEIRAGVDLCKVRLAKERIFFYEHAREEVDTELEYSKKPTCLLEELPLLEWARTSQTVEKNLKEVPQDLNNHGCDVMRYVVASQDLNQGVLVRRL